MLLHELGLDGTLGERGERLEKGVVIRRFGEEGELFLLGVGVFGRLVPFYIFEPLPAQIFQRLMIVIFSRENKSGCRSCIFVVRGWSVGRPLW